MWASIRLILGIVLLAAGVEKTLSHYQNFLYVIQAYQMVPAWLEDLTARLLPWLELFTGLFLVVGLWSEWALKCAAVQFALFIVVVGQALMRHLPIDQCGCFGELIHVAPTHIIIFDSMMLLLAFMALRNLPRAQNFSLDRYFSQT